MSSPTPRVSLAVEAMFFGGNSLIVVAAGAVFVVVVAAAVEVVADVPAEVVDVVAVVDGGVVVEELDVVVDVDVVDDELDDVVVDDVDDVVDDVPDDGAVGVPLTAFDATESPMAFMALIVTEYAVPFVRPVMVNGLVVDAGERAVYVVPSVEYL
jgi:hypothetical protein